MKEFKLTSERSKELARKIHKLEMKSSRVEKILEGGVRGIWVLETENEKNGVFLVRNEVIIIEQGDELPNNVKNRTAFSTNYKAWEACYLMQEIFLEEKRTEMVCLDYYN